VATIEGQCIVPADNVSEGVVLQYNVGGPSGPCNYENCEWPQ
jgi:hypothetical protein